MPAGVLASVVRARVDAVVAGLGVNVPVAPVGNPSTLSVTCPEKPPAGVMATPKFTALPCVTDWLPGDPAIVKSGTTGAVTTRETVAVCVRLPLTPVMVSVDVPTGVVAKVVMLSADVDVAGFVVKVPVAPVGNPLTLSVTAPLKPPEGVIVTG